MTKKELIAAVAAEADETENTVEGVIDALVEVATTTLAEGCVVDVGPFGRFVPRKEAAHEGHNPADGTPIEVPAQVRILFHPSGELRDRVNTEVEQG